MMIKALRVCTFVLGTLKVGKKCLNFLLQKLHEPCFLTFFFLLQALEEALNLHTPSASQQPPAQGNFADAANNLKKQELLTQIAVLKEQVRQQENIHTSTHRSSGITHPVPDFLVFYFR